MKKITKIKTIGLTLALAMLYNGGYAQDEAAQASVQTTESVVQTAPTPEDVKVPGEVENKNEAAVPTDTTEIKPEEKVEAQIDVPSDVAKAEEVVTEGNKEVTISEEGKDEIAPDVSGEKEDKSVVTNPLMEETKEASVQTVEAKEIVINSLEETILFRFLQDCAFFNEASRVIFEKNTEEVGEDIILPFADLSQKLYAKLIELAESEGFPHQDLDKRAQDEEAAWATFVKEKPNLSDLFSLFVDSTFKKAFNENSINFSDEVGMIKNNTKDVLSKENLDHKTLITIYADALKNYTEFVNQNKEILEKIKVIADNDFQIENNSQEKECINYRNKEYCSIVATKPIKSLRELMAYVQKM